MNLNHLFKIQRKLDERIEQEHPRQEEAKELAKTERDVRWVVDKVNDIEVGVVDTYIHYG